MKLGDISKTEINPMTTITDEEVLEAARKAAIKIDFNYKSDAPAYQDGQIIYIYHKD